MSRRLSWALAPACLLAGWLYGRGDRAAPADPLESSLAAAPPLQDPWLAYEASLKQIEAGCAAAAGATPAESCFVRLASVPHPEMGSRPNDLLLADLRSGHLLLEAPGIAEMLYQAFGISPAFLGTGLVEPQGKETDYAAARAHEYLIPNLSDSASSVWTWELKPVAGDLKRPLLDTILATPAAAGQARFAKFYRDTIAKEPEDTEVPAVIRFGKFPLERYKHMLGRAEARRVFAMRLSDVSRLTVEDAAKLSGYTFIDTGEDNTLFIWVYQPSLSSEVVPATWHHIMRHASQWL